MAKWCDEKARYKQYKARKEQLPASYHEALGAVERHALSFGPAKGDSLLSLVEDLVALFEQGAANGTAVSEIVGDNPVEFVDTFLTTPTPAWRRSPRPANGWFGLCALTITRPSEDFV